LKPVQNAELKKAVVRHLKVLGLTDSRTTAPKLMEDVQIVLYSDVQGFANP